MHLIQYKSSFFGLYPIYLQEITQLIAKIKVSEWIQTGDLQ